MIDTDLYCTQVFNSAVIDKQLQTDLRNQIVRIAQAVQIAAFPQPGVLLQPTTNSLRKSVEQLHFFDSSGQCRGASLWFIALVMNFKKKYPDVSTPTLLVAIAKEFEEGVGIQGAYLQKVHAEGSGEDRILGLLNVELQPHAEWDMRNKNVSAEIMEKVHVLEEGIYLLSFSGYQADRKEDSIPGHATVIIVEKGNYYFFDINAGLAGTGKDIGTADKIRDVAFLLLLCKNYSSSERANELFEKGWQNLQQILGERNGKLVQKAIAEDRKLFLEGRSWMSAFGVCGIIKGLESRGNILSEEVSGELMLNLCIRPGMLQVHLESAEKLRLKKCVFLG